MMTALIGVVVVLAIFTFWPAAHPKAFVVVRA